MQKHFRRARRGPWTTLAVGSAVVAMAATLTACGSTGGSATPSSSRGSATAGLSPNKSTATDGTAAGPTVVESNPPGDIPDNQAFVRYAGTGFTVSIPEGWARSSAGTAAVFSDKYNNITVSSAPAPQAPTTTSARLVELPKIEAASAGFSAGAISEVQRKSGSAVLITYRAFSAVNPVTGKVANEAVERYTFWRSGTAVALTLAAPVGSDNVDPWRTVTDSFTWTK